MPSITEKINELETPNGEFGQHRNTLIKMETAIEETIRPIKTYLLLMYAWRQRIQAKKDIGDYCGILRPSRTCSAHIDETVHEFMIRHEGRDVAYFYFHYDLKNDTVYVTSGSVATQAITITEIIDVLKATIGIDN